MIKMLCLIRNESEMLAIKKHIRDEILDCKELPYYQRWVRPGKQFGPMITENCEIDFRLPNPDKTGGLSVDLVYGVFDCDYSDEIIAILTSKRDLGLQKKYGKSGLPIWEIVLDIEKRYALVAEGVFKSFEERDYGNHIYKDEEDGQFNIMADTGDPFQWGSIENVNYCPYCGRRLGNDDI